MGLSMNLATIKNWQSEGHWFGYIQLQVRENGTNGTWTADWRPVLSTPKEQPYTQPSSTEPRIAISGCSWSWPCTYKMAAIASLSPPDFLVVVVVRIKSLLCPCPELSHMNAPWWKKTGGCHQGHSSMVVGFFAGHQPKQIAWLLVS